MKTPLEPGETVVKDGKANLQRGIETVGGQLTLTDRRLVFESHAFNVQTGTTVVPLGDIAKLDLVWTRFLGLVPIAPNSLAVTTTAGVEHRFVLFGRDQWKAAIERLRSGAA